MAAVSCECVPPADPLVSCPKAYVGVQVCPPPALDHQVCCCAQLYMDADPEQQKSEG